MSTADIYDARCRCVLLWRSSRDSLITLRDPKDGNTAISGVSCHMREARKIGVRQFACNSESRGRHDAERGRGTGVMGKEGAIPITQNSQLLFAPRKSSAKNKSALYLDRKGCVHNSAALVTHCVPGPRHVQMHPAVPRLLSLSAFSLLSMRSTPHFERVCSFPPAYLFPPLPFSPFAPQCSRYPARAPCAHLKTLGLTSTKFVYFLSRVTTNLCTSFSIRTFAWSG